LEVIIFALLLEAQLGFKCGVNRIIAKLFELDIVPAKNGVLPSQKAYDTACAKLPVEVLVSILAKSHQSEYASTGRLFHEYKVIIPDGTKISMLPTSQTIEKYGKGEGHYVQSQALGFFELSTGTFEDFIFENHRISERFIMRRHMESNSTKTLYLCDAGYNGMAFIAIAEESGHKVLMQLKCSALGKSFLKSKKRSAIYQIKLTKSHLRSYPDHQHYLGKIIQVRLVRTRGTSRLASQVLITTLLDEKKYSWQEMSKLYLQRYSVELAFRHLKTTIKIEQIKKQNMQKIEQRLYAAIILFNIAAGIRNRIKRLNILPEKEGVKMHCFTLCIEMAHVFCRAVMRKKHSMKKMMNKCLTAIRNCWFVYKPWRSEPRICHTPPSEFSVQKGAVILKEFEKSEFLKTEYEILKREYGQKEGGFA
jgi:hypothetical protein